MKKLSILFIVIGLLLVGCSQKEQNETRNPVGKSNSGSKLEHLDLKGKYEIALFNTVVSDSTKEPGIGNVSNPQYQFSLGEESYLLWITVDNGTIMNVKDTHTIYSLSSSSIKEVNEFIEKN